MNKELQAPQQITVPREEILEYIFEHGRTGPVGMNEYLEHFHAPNPKVFIPVFREFEKNKWVQCQGNYAWLGSWHTGELLDLNNPQTYFTCQLLPAGADYLTLKHTPPPVVEEKKQTHPIAEKLFSPLRLEKNTVPWYEHWVFWLVMVCLFMGTMIGLVEMNGQ
jgi:hypothetical protein